MGELTFDPDHGGDVIVARFEGEIDAANAPELRFALAARLPSTASVLALDLSGVSYLDSSGIELLFELSHSLAARRQTIRLIVPETAPIRRVLKLCAVESVASIDGDLAGVLRAIDRPTYEDMMTNQIGAAVVKSGPGSLEKLINSGDTWVVDYI